MVAWGGVPIQKTYLKQNQFPKYVPPIWGPQWGGPRYAVAPPRYGYGGVGSLWLP
jgi:hypothetical protein